MRRFDDEDLSGAEFRECDLSGLATVLDEEWAHHGFAARDLDLVQGRVRRIS